jgi:hypothetical protein
MIALLDQRLEVGRLIADTTLRRFGGVSRFPGGDSARTASIVLSQPATWFQPENRGSTISKSLISND